MEADGHRLPAPLDLRSIQWRDDADIAAFRHHLEELRSLPEHSGLAFGFVDLPCFVQKSPAQRQNSPRFRIRIEFCKDQLLAGQQA